MPGESPTKWQAQAYRFGVRRLESAVSSGDPLLRGDPLRRRLNISLLISIVLAALLLGAFAVYGFVKPAPKIGNAAVVVDEDTGGAFVSRDGRLYPAMNLSSALLAAGRGQSGDTTPSMTTVNSETIGTEARGPMLGIPGAPNVLSHDLVDSSWTVCDTTKDNPALPPGSKPVLTTTALVGEHRPSSGALGTRAMLVKAFGAHDTYLLFDGRRAKIDPGDDTVQLAFGISSGEVPRPISAALLDAVPLGPDLAPPTIDAQGTSVPYTDALGVRVGEVFSIERADRTRPVYVALADGVEKITPLVGDLIRDRYSQAKELPLVAPEALRQAPVSTKPIDTSVFPTVRPALVGYSDSATACVARTGTDPDNAVLFALPAPPLPAGAKPVSVTRPGALTVDDVYLRTGTAGVFAAVTAAQTVAGGRPLYLVTDDGVAYPVVSQLALAYLGYHVGDITAVAPDLIALLPHGPTLDPDAAVHFYPQTGVSANSLPSASAAPSPQG